jgi:hypothetical protein
MNVDVHSRFLIIPILWMFSIFCVTTVVAVLAIFLAAPMARKNAADSREQG